ncbi:MAG TPA: bifunctional phosphoglucose/phosphomannose isomerase, partial [Candidatus Limnocylindrales bacterium]|nr:bifunctional phosphoglucose/phosphomannose isomerase [Candidatus Limnocylindrales bacterium]
TSVAVLGMGGSAIGADLVRGIFDDRLSVPLVAVRDYVLPAWVGPTTLVVASSYSGATEETVAALAAALERHAPVVVLTTGGPLLEVARQADLPCLAFPGGGQPRAAVGYAVGLLAGTLERAARLDLETAEVEAAATATRAALATFGPERVTAVNPAKQLAWTLVDRLPLVVGSGALAAVARRWKTQLNENGKSAAVFDELPEADHNSVVGFGHPEWQAEQVHAVFLASAVDHPRDRLRAALTRELLDEVRVGHSELELPGTSRLEAGLAGVAAGDLVSVYLGLLYGIDPTPVAILGRLKERLAATAD